MCPVRTLGGFCTGRLLSFAQRACKFSQKDVSYSIIIGYRKTVKSQCSSAREYNIRHFLFVLEAALVMVLNLEHYGFDRLRPIWSISHNLINSTYSFVSSTVFKKLTLDIFGH